MCLGMGSEKMSNTFVKEYKYQWTKNQLWFRRHHWGLAQAMKTAMRADHTTVCFPIIRFSHVVTKKEEI